MTTRLAQSRTWCRRFARRTAPNFYFSFLTLPRHRLVDMCILYSFMRITDDLGDDETRPLADREQALDAWRDQLNAALAGQPTTHPSLPALVDLIERHRITVAHLKTVIEGVRGDLHPVRVETFDELSAYCYAVAGVVGLCCIQVWGCHDPAAHRLAIQCGMAFQLTNILRDVEEDWRRNRIYLPREDLQRFGYSEDDLSRSVQDERWRGLMRFEADRARACYAQAEQLFAYLPRETHGVLRAMIGIYRGLLDRIERSEFAVFGRRQRLPLWRKLAIVAAATWPTRWRSQAANTNAKHPPHGKAEGVSGATENDEACGDDHSPIRY